MYGDKEVSVWRWKNPKKTSHKKGNLLKHVNLQFWEEGVRGVQEVNIKSFDSKTFDHIDFVNKNWMDVYNCC